jgi:hypothetical protein
MKAKMTNQDCVCFKQPHEIAQQLKGPVFLGQENASQVPDDCGGVYAIYNKMKNPPECLWVGRAGQNGGSLRSRIFTQHLKQGHDINAGSDLIYKVQLKIFGSCTPENRQHAQKWIAENCEVRWLALPDIEYALKKHLNPTWTKR